MDIPIDPEIEAVVLQKVESGEYPSVAAIVEEALFLLVQRDWDRSKHDLLGRIGPEASNLLKPPTEDDR